MDDSFGERGWAPRNDNLTTEERQANMRVIEFIVGTLGGYKGMKTQGVEMFNLSWILEADPSNDISGYRLLVDHMGDGFNSSAPDLPFLTSTERPMPPHVARYWLLRTQRAEDAEGILVPTEVEDHIALAGISIANGDKSRLLSEAYADAANEVQLSPLAVGAIAMEIMDSYLDDPDVGRF